MLVAQLAQVPAITNFTDNKHFIPRSEFSSHPTFIITLPSIRLESITDPKKQFTMASNKPTTAEVPLPQGEGDLYTNTIDRPMSTEESEDRGSDYDAGVPGTRTAATHDIDRRAKMAAATEIGDPEGRIPSAEQTREHLAAALNSELPVDASRDLRNHPQSPLHNESSLNSKAREHRKSNYAPGYEKAFDAVPQRSYDADGHEPAVLPHEQLESGSRA